MRVPSKFIMATFFEKVTILPWDEDLVLPTFCFLFYYCSHS